VCAVPLRSCKAGTPTSSRFRARSLSSTCMAPRSAAPLSGLAAPTLPPPSGAFPPHPRATRQSQTPSPRSQQHEDLHTKIEISFCIVPCRTRRPRAPALPITSVGHSSSSHILLNDARPDGLYDYAALTSTLTSAAEDTSLTPPKSLLVAVTYFSPAGAWFRFE